MLSGNRLRVNALWHRNVDFNPVCPSRWPRGISIAVSEPNCPSQPVSDSLPGLKTLHSEPADPLELALWLIIAIFNPECPSWPPSKALPGGACSGCRSGAGSRSTQCCRGQRLAAAAPALRLRLSLRKIRLRRPLRHLPLSGAGAKPARICQPCSLRTGKALPARWPSPPPAHCLC